MVLGLDPSDADERLTSQWLINTASLIHNQF